jgi:putative FmdB family regulatory protein
VPIHDYTCASCGHLIEVIHGIHEGGPRFCPSCGAEGTMRRGFSAPAVHFKGSGWAKKDRSSASSAGRSKTAKSGEDSSSAPGTGTSAGDGKSASDGKSGTEGTASTAGGATAAASSAADGGD